jgi:hypothetical protein
MMEVERRELNFFFFVSFTLPDFDSGESSESASTTEAAEEAAEAPPRKGQKVDIYVKNL